MRTNNSNGAFIDYLSLARPDHWVKNLFMFPGLALAMAFAAQNSILLSFTQTLIAVTLTLGSLCLASSANYTINEWLDRTFDKYHPEKRFRPSVAKNLSAKKVWAQYSLLIVTSLLLALAVSRTVFSLIASLLLMGVLYNVRPFRLKDRYYLDVISESVNNPIRVALGWYIAIREAFFPASAFIAFWAAGVFLMSLKRYTEITILGESSSLTQYRRSFGSWTPAKLLKFSLTGAITTTTFLGVLLAGYKIEYILLFPSIVFLFQYYFGLALRLRSEVSAPEDLWKNNVLNIQILGIMVLTIVLSFIEIPVLHDLVGFER
jgi:decaprenyl-phosphate phosphoribosyltransferase